MVLVKEPAIISMYSEVMHLQVVLQRLLYYVSDLTIAVKDTLERVITTNSIKDINKTLDQVIEVVTLGLKRLS